MNKLISFVLYIIIFDINGQEISSKKHTTFKYTTKLLDLNEFTFTLTLLVITIREDSQLGRSYA